MCDRAILSQTSSANCSTLIPKYLIIKLIVKVKTKIIIKSREQVAVAELHPGSQEEEVQSLSD